MIITPLEKSRSGGPGLPSHGPNRQAAKFAKFAKNEWLEDQASLSKKDSTLWLVVLGELDEVWRLAVYVSRLEVES